MTAPHQDYPPRYLFENYLARANNRHKSLEVIALRTQSRGLRDVLAHGASLGSRTYSELNAAVLAREAVAVDPQHLASLARVRALQNFDDDDRPFALEALALANPMLPPKRALVYRRLEAQLLLERSEFKRLAELMQTVKGLREHPELNADLYNPFTNSPYANMDKWLVNFNQRITAAGHEPISVQPGAGEPFDRMAAVAPAVPDSGLISVIMTTYRPDRHAIIGSVKSILNQTWRNIELIIVDDGSPAEYAQILDEVLSLDDRITVVRLTENRGTYAARNHALALAQGIYITGQDDDDWSHPRRLEVQARTLNDNQNVPAVRLASLPAHSNLIRTRLGYGYVGENSSSLMFRTRWRELMGGYLPVRKAADNEFHHRLEAMSGQQVEVLAEPLTIIRFAPNSLSRGDYRPGWIHPARRAFRSSYTHWHSHSRKLTVDPSAPPPIHVPRRFEIAGRPQDQFDVVLARDWRDFNWSQRAALDEIAALREQGLRVGILHLEAPEHLEEAPSGLSRPIRRLINSGSVTQVFADDDIAVRLLVVQQPTLLQFEYAFRAQLRVDRIIVLVDEAPIARNGRETNYRTLDCNRNAIRLFDRKPTWVPRGPTVRRALEKHLSNDDLSSYDIPSIIRTEGWESRRTRFRSGLPVIGRHSHDTSLDWPNSRSALLQIYPIDGSVDVRILGGTTIPRKILNSRHEPAAWLSFTSDALPVRTFLNSIDYFVYYPHDEAPAVDSARILEAIAAGCIAVLPPFLEEIFGAAAVYAPPGDAIQLVRDLHSEPQRHWRQVAKSAEFLSECFDHSIFGHRIVETLNHSQN